MTAAECEVMVLLQIRAGKEKFNIGIHKSFGKGMEPT